MSKAGCSLERFRTSKEILTNNKNEEMSKKKRLIVRWTYLCREKERGEGERRERKRERKNREKYKKILATPSEVFSQLFDLLFYAFCFPTAVVFEIKDFKCGLHPHGG